MARLGMTIPLAGIPLADHRDWLREMLDLGYTDFIVSVQGPDWDLAPLERVLAWRNGLG